MAGFNFDDYPEDKASTFNFEDFPEDKPQAPEDTRSALDTFKDAMDVSNWARNATAGLQRVDENVQGPVRKFVTEKVTGEKMDHAPTGKEQAIMMGATDKTYRDIYGDYFPDVSPAGIYGAGLDVIQDPLTLISGALKGGSKLIRGISEFGAEQNLAKQSIKTSAEQSALATAESAAKASATVSGGATKMEQGGKLFSINQPKNLEELRKWKAPQRAGQLVGKQRLKDIEGIVPDLQTKPLNYHYDMMENPKAMKDLKLQFENLPTEDSKKIAAYNQSMVDESASKIKQTVQDIGGSEPRSLTDAGYDFISSAKDKYNAEKDALGPMFDEIQKRSGNMNNVASRDLATAIGENTKLGKLMSQDENTGRMFLQKNSPRSGLSDQEHGILSRVIDDLNDGMTFKEVQDTRDFLRKSIDPSNPAATTEISKVRSVMLGQLEGMASKYGPDVGETFKAYAVNERARENIEKVIGGKIESLDSMFSANPDKVVQKVFSNPNYAKVVGEYVGENKMKEMVASYVQKGLDKSFDSVKGFQPHTLKTWLKTNQNILSANLEPQVLERLNALADYGYYGKRYLDEVNPSGTAASLLAAIKPETLAQKISTQGFMATARGETIGRAGAALKQKQATEALNQSLGGMNPTVGGYLKNKMQINPEFDKYFDSTVKVNAGASAIDVTQPFKAQQSQKDNPDQSSYAKPMNNYASIMHKAQGSKYAQVLEQAKQKGEQSLAAAHFVLSSRDPEYKKVIEGN